MEQMDFVDRIFEAAPKAGYSVDRNRNGDRQIECGIKNLTDDDVRWLYQDICKHRGRYTRPDFEKITLGRPCAVAPFFKIAKSAELCSEVQEGAAKVYEFKFAVSERK
jgi:hypothetical protein